MHASVSPFEDVELEYVTIESNPALILCDSVPGDGALLPLRLCKAAVLTTIPPTPAAYMTLILRDYWRVSTMTGPF